jgi:predicted nucleotidyltransferase
MEDLQRKAQDACAERGADLLFLGLSGSHATGTATEKSDQDVRGVFLPPWNVLVGLDKLETIELEPDIVMHSLRKFVKLCAQGNPNMLDWLFMPDECVWIIAPQFKGHIRGNREMFLSKQLHARFRGYAHGHLQKMERGVTRHLGEKRKQDILEFGYSTKNAMHMIRLARMGCEVLETGVYRTRRPDAAELLDIRAGKWTLEEVRREGGALLARLDLALAQSALPERPDKAHVNKVLVSLTLALKRW